MPNNKSDIDNHIDDHVDVEISNCIDLKTPKSFFLFAGAGSGKTRSLISTLSKFRKDNGHQLRLHGQRVAIITYTNAACNEIKRRLDYDPLFAVTTIHSFVWDLVYSFQIDIKNWLRQNLSIQIEELQSQQQNGRAGTKTAMDREKNIENKLKRIQNLENIEKFTYNPNGDNRSRDSLNHTEVINIGAFFLNNKLLMQKILIRKFPILLIDESQDTNKELLDALFKVQKENNNRFVLGLFGDTMQRIYSDGKVDLGINLPENWAKPAKIMNHRCPKRIIKLLNKIRSSVDHQEQRPRTDAAEGTIRLFILPSDINKIRAENVASERMAQITNDLSWSGTEKDYKTLILEHHMAASRMGFLDLFEPLSKIDRLRTGLLDGSLPGLNFFRELVLPIIRANKIGDQFSITKIVIKYSPLINKKNMISAGKHQLIHIKAAQLAVYQLLSLWDDSNEPTCRDVLQCISRTKLFDIPDSLYPIASRTNEEQDAPEGLVEDNLFDKGSERLELEAWDQCLSAPFQQISSYVNISTRQSRCVNH